MDSDYHQFQECDHMEMDIRLRVEAFFPKKLGRRSVNLHLMNLRYNINLPGASKHMLTDVGTFTA